MPKLQEKMNNRSGTNTENQTSSEMEQETENEIHSEAPNLDSNEDKKEIELDVDNIENETIMDHSGFTYEPEKYKNSFLPQNDLAKAITLNALKVMLIQVKIKVLKEKVKGADEIYFVNKEWYNKWKKYSRYGTLKRIMKNYTLYESKPIKYTPDEKFNPGEINNKEIMIRYRLDKNEGRNILVSKFNDALDTKLNKKMYIKVLSKERFKLLSEFYKCDHVLKAKKYESKDNITFEGFTAHLNIIFIPTLESFKEVNKEDYGQFKNKHNIIYDIYLRQNAKRKEIVNELKNIYKEKPEIISNMGIKFSNEEELLNQVQLLRYYHLHEENKKSIQEILDYVFTGETIEKIKKGEKIASDDIKIRIINPNYLDLNDIFRQNWSYIKDNVDKVENGLIIVEYIPKENDVPDFSNSIFEKVKRRQNLHNEEAAHRIENGMDIEHVPHHYRKDYKLEEQPLDEKENRHGLVGLNNLGNTCYMNTGLQCLSNCELLTKYILGNYYEKQINKDNPIGSQGEIIEKFALIIKHLWYGSNDCISPIQFKQAFGKVYQAFNDYRQQDTQEFISYLLDSLHEDLNKVLKKPYIQTKDLPDNLKDEEIFNIKRNLYLCRNQSFIADLIYGFYKSTVFCPNEKCKNISKSFEPFNMITLPLVNEVELRKIEEFKEEENKRLGIIELNITFIPFKINYKPLYFQMRIKKDVDILTFKKKVEVITGFSHNSFEIYKIQGKEYIAIKDDINCLEDFLEKEKKIYLFQLPPYVFGKELDFYDKNYNKLNCDNDKLFLEEEKYEGNDLYKEYNEYNKKENNNQAENSNDHNINEIKMEEEKKEEENDDNKIDQNEINVNTNHNNNNPNIENNDNNNQIADSQKTTKNQEGEEDIEMDDQTLRDINIDKSQWIKAELYNYSYSFQPEQKDSIKEGRIARSRIIYLNINWSNAEIYECIMKILDGARNDMDEIKAMWFQDLKDITSNLEQMNKTKDSNLYDYFNELSTQPLMIKYLRYFNFNKQDIKTKEENHENSIVIYDPNEFMIKKIVEEALNNKDNSIEDLEILFKVIWKPNFASDYKEGIEPTILEKSEKLEEVLRAAKEDEYLKKNNLKKNEKEEKKNKNKLNLEELLNNFNQIEKLSKNNEWFCPKCKNHQLANKKMEIYSISEVVIIHLKRFRNNRKIETFVDFPIENLDLTKYLPNKKEKYVYDLFAVANHMGGLHGGHYFAYCKNCKDGEWYEFNDSNVDKMDKNKIVTENAYVLFYSRKREEGNKINEEELFNKPFINIDHSLYE